MVALEFAIVAIPFLTLVFAVLEIGFDLFVQVSLDSAVELAARGVQTGVSVGTAGESSAQFAAAAVCPGIAGLLNCASLTVAVAPIATGYNYYTNPNAPTFSAASSGMICTGVGGQVMLITAWYAGPTFVGALLPDFTTTVNGATVHLTTASAGFVNDYFVGGQSSGSAC